MEELIEDRLYKGLIKSDTTKCAKYNDIIILYGDYGHIYSTKLKPGGVSNLKYGSFKHENIVGKHFGTKIYNDYTKKWLVILRPTAEFITLTIPHHTQILYHADISLILMLLDARPGKQIIETGTGCGSLSVSLARAITPGGHLYTYEIHDERFEKAKEAFKNYEMDSVITIENTDIYQKGFSNSLIGKIDGIFLDLPVPWLVTYNCKLVLKEGGYLVNFSPCIEQVQKFSQELIENNFTGIRTFEILTKTWGISFKTKFETHKGSLEHQTIGDLDYTQYQHPIRSHTGYLTVSRKSITSS